MNKFKSSFWEVSLPDDWEINEDEECISFYTNNGIGALQISSYTEVFFSSNKELEQLIREEVPIDIVLQDINLSNLKGYKVIYSEEDTYWIKWFIPHKDKLI